MAPMLRWRTLHEPLGISDYLGAIFVVSCAVAALCSVPNAVLTAAREGESSHMDPTIMAYVIQAIGGAVGGNVLGAITRGGGGFLGRTVIGAIGGVAAGFAGGNVEAVGNITSMWSNLAEGDMGGYLANGITGAAGGGILGLIGGLLIRPRG